LTPIETHTQFENVDLDLSSKRDLSPLISALHAQVILLHAGRRGRGGSFWARLELAKQPRTCDQALRRFATLLKRLPPAARRTWNGATLREFNIGVQVGRQPYASEFVVSPDTVIQIARLRARLRITVYSPFQVRRRSRRPTSRTTRA